MMDDEWLHISGCVNSQKDHYWSTEDLKEQFDVLLHDEKLEFGEFFQADELQATIF